MRIYHCIRLGLKNLPGYGSHPGTLHYILFIVWGVIVGLLDKHHPLKMAITGAIFMAVMIGIAYFYGAYDRGNGWLLIQQKRAEQEGHSNMAARYRHGNVTGHFGYD